METELESSDPLGVVERVVEILTRGSFTSTYKYAVLLGLIDLCASGEVADSVATRQLAAKVVEIYWPMAQPWPEVNGVLRQSSQGTAARGGSRIVGLILDFHADTRERRTHAVAAARHPAEYEKLVREVEWTLVEMPLPKLQRVAGEPMEWLYRLHWDDGATLPRKAQVTTPQRHPGFDPTISLLPGVREAFRRLAPILRPLVQEYWMRRVQALNRREDDRLRKHLFGASRENLDPVRGPLVRLQQGCCFYCEQPLKTKIHVDHFVPWARYRSDDLGNLVAAHARCNADKSDHLAGLPHVTKWRNRLDGAGESLQSIANDIGWLYQPDSMLRTALSHYELLPPNAPLWVGVGKRDREGNEAVLRVLRE